MPQINRIRIINFSYNNHNRNIVDETFDFFQGENALLNLKNGGGKSVLVQLLLQPIIPKTRLMSRRLEDFFKGKKTPSYILIEWKLEDQGGYFLTGVALSNRESQVREQEDANNSLKYFTFTSNYREANPFDIENIPLIEKTDGNIVVKGFKEARKRLKERDATAQLTLFNDDDGVEYRKHLESFNIFQDEWKSIVLKINESEGGVIEIFEKCKTSQQLMNDWILKSIEKVVNKEDRDQKKLEQMLENLVEEMIKNEQFIYEKEMYETFLKESSEFMDKLNKLTESLDEEKDVERRIANMYFFLKKSIQQMNEQVEKHQEDISASEVELQKIKLEERSKDYYDALDKVHTLKEQLYIEENKLQEVRAELAQKENEATLQEAARDYERVKNLTAKIAGINTEINKLKNIGNQNEEIRNLEYSLKIRYENECRKLEQKQVEVNDQLEQLVKKLSNLDKSLKDIDKENSKLQTEKGSLQSEIKQFERTEQQTCDELELSYERNLLGEIEQAYFDAFQEKMERKKESLHAEQVENSDERQKLDERSGQIKENLISLREEQAVLVANDTQLAEKIYSYHKIEDAIRQLFDKYGLDFTRRFNHEENVSFIKKRIGEMEKNVRDLEFNSHTITETMKALEKGTLHVSNDFRQWLMNHDFDFETGENYLRKQSESVKARLLQENPILPYAFLLNEGELQRLNEMEIDCKTQHIVPVISYSDVNKMLVVNGNAVNVQNKLQLFSLYDNRMFNSSSLDNYLEELAHELTQVTEQLLHFKNELEVAREEKQLLKQFTFDKDYLWKLEKEKDSLEQKMKSIKEEISKLDEELQRIANRKSELEKRDNEIEQLLSIEKKRKEKFEQFLEANENYIKNRHALEHTVSRLKSLQKEKEELEKEKEVLSNRREELRISKNKTELGIKEKAQKYKLYENAQEAVLLEEEIYIMEEKLQKLKSEISNNLEWYEKNLKEAKQELEEKQDTLLSYELEDSQYKDVTFYAEKLKELQKVFKEIEAKEKQNNSLFHELKGEFRNAEGKFEAAEKEVKNLAGAPLEKSLIKLNFRVRRKAEKESIAKANEAIQKLGDQSKAYEKLSNKLEGKIDLSNHEVNAKYDIKVNVNADYEALVKQHSDMKKSNENHEKNVTRQYSNLKASYEQKNQHIQNVMTGLDYFVEAAVSDKDQYYYLGERMLQSNEALQNLIRACEQRLMNVEKNKKDMVQHSYLHAKQVYDEVQKIAENSSIKIDGKNRPIPMLKIEMEALRETDEENIKMMKEYIEDSVKIIKKDMKEDKKIEEIRKKISKYMSTKELLNVLSDLGKMKVSAYKIDINAKNSTYKTWEQVMKENSGGERFVSFFAVLVALMSYTRTSMKYVDDYDRNTDTKVLIMDNPFGPISSEHLLKPLFNIASKYNTQLICLTDLKQNSILNCFNLIYMIKIRQNVFGTSEYLKLEQQIKEDATLEKDEKLEKAVFKAKEVEQMSLL
ncbi:hypothetical protein CIB95_11745 [Lottiidibacillus patelloidae]|uniref:Chromosome segregation ATPase n=1 Tax=Lottiidibacillus patelloidae TaxID=2670334 RepID=A0A263BRU9_9BACI|nr:hypothetical protein [Lottiidibacillus patelloidae]OZM56441.1 hypothetical protein CIB95_11745 [Lottiidibacillus patelloidae]